MSEEKSFEKELDALKDAVDRLESGELTLQQALETYAEGRAHAKTCQGMLDDARTKISVLSGKGTDLSIESHPESDVGGEEE